MGFAVYHMEKGSGGSGGIGKHIDREKSKDGHSTFEHADISKQHLNQSIKVNGHCSKPLSQAIEDRIKEGYTQTKAIRKDAVKFQTHILTGSHEDMKNIFENNTTANKWIQENLTWMSEKYGKENIVRFTLHMDEKTPHIHAVTVPITKDGGISAKSYANGKKALKELQTDYAKRMEQFDLQRGIENTGVKHETAQEYYNRNKYADQIIKEKQVEPIEYKGNILSNNKKDIIEQNKNFSEKLKSLTSKNIELEKHNNDLKQANSVLNLNSKKYGKKVRNHQNKELSLKTELKNPSILLEKLNEIIKDLPNKITAWSNSVTKMLIWGYKKDYKMDIEQEIKRFSPEKKLGMKDPKEVFDFIGKLNKTDPNEEYKQFKLQIETDFEAEKKLFQAEELKPKLDIDISENVSYKRGRGR